MPRVQDIPSADELDHLVHQVADGVPSEINYVWDNFSYLDCIRELMMKRYDNYVQDTVMKAISNG